MATTSAGEGRRGVGDDCRAGRHEGVVAETRGETGPTLDKDLDLQLLGKSADAIGRERDSLLVWSGFGRDADFHEVTVAGVAGVEALRTPSGFC